VRGEIGVGVSGRGGGSIGEILVFERGENKRRDTMYSRVKEPLRNTPSKYKDYR
jgi:hypothetical protein